MSIITEIVSADQIDVCPICNKPGHPREKFLTASDIAKVLGVSRFGSALDVYMDKMGLSAPKDVSKMPWLEGGHRLEAPILDWYVETRGVEDVGRQTWMTHPDLPWLGFHPDLIVQNADRDQWNVECKVVGGIVASLWGDENTDNVPADVLYQTHFQTFISGAHRTDVVALFGGQWPPKVFNIGRDDELINLVLPILRDFWFNHVVKGVPPEPNFGGETTAALLQELYPVQKDKVVELPLTMRVGTSDVDTIDLMQIKDVIGKEIKKLETYKRAIENRFRAEFRQQGGTIGDLGGVKVKLIEVASSFVPAYTRDSYDYVKVSWPKGYQQPAINTEVMKQLEEETNG